jgi:glycosyltransferase involved in cell wall biosynthesis
MKIVFIGNPNSAHIRRYVRDLSQRGNDVFLIGDHPLGQPYEFECPFYDLTQTINIRKIRYLLWPIRIRILLNQIKPDLVHAFGVASAGWLARLCGFRPFIVSATGSDLMLLENRSFIHQFLTKWVIRNADSVICVSRPIFDRALQLGARQNKTNLIYIGVDYSIFSPGDRLEARKQLGLPDVPLVISIRAMSPIYRPLDIARAIPTVLASHPLTRFIVFVYNVDQNTFEEFQQIILDAGASHSVIYVEAIKDDRKISLYYQSANMALSIPASDGTPSSVLEAMACGLPVIATDLPSLQEWITPGKTGILINIGDIPALAKGIITLLNNPSLGEEMGQQASQEVRQRGERSKVMNQLEAIYHSV